jgi:hypothetical protein
MANNCREKQDQKATFPHAWVVDVSSHSLLSAFPNGRDLMDPITSFAIEIKSCKSLFCRVVKLKARTMSSFPAPRFLAESADGESFGVHIAYIDL